MAKASLKARSGVEIITGLILIGAGLIGFYSLLTHNKKPPVSLFTLKEGPLPDAQGNLYLLYYAQGRYSQGDSSTAKFFKSDIARQKEVELNIETGNSWTETKFSGSQDGKFVARWDSKVIAIACVKDVSSFKTIVEITKASEAIQDVLWANDSSRLAYIVKKCVNPFEYFVYSCRDFESQLYTINPDGSGQILVKNYRLPCGVMLFGFNAGKNELYWFEKRPDKRSIFNFTSFSPANFTVVNLSDGATRIIQDTLNPDYPEQITSPSDLNTVYYVKDFQIIEHQLSSGAEKVLYEPDRVTKVVFDKKNKERGEMGFKPFINKLVVSPHGNLLLFEKFDESADHQMLYALTLPQGEIKVFFGKSYDYTLTGHPWSPEGRYFLIESKDRERYYLLDTQTKTVGSFFEDKAMHSKFIAWLVE